MEKLVEAHLLQGDGLSVFRFPYDPVVGLFEVVAQSVNFKYCAMVCLAVCSRPLVEGILAVYFWTPGPVIHMIWGTEVAVSSGKRFTVVCPAVIDRTCVKPFLPTIVNPIVLSRCLSRFGVDLDVGPRFPESPLYVS